MINSQDKTKIIFLGTPDFASICLKELIEDDSIDVLFSITKPDVQKNRGMGLVEPEVKIVSKEYGIDCYQPTKLRNDAELISLIKDSNPDFLIVVAYGEILSKEILAIPRKACINGHASLLPKYRGSSPIQTALLNGDKETGVTTMLMSYELDAGDILEQEVVEINDKETSGQLFDRLKLTNAKLMLHTIKHFDELTPIKQDESKVTKCNIIKKEDGLIDLMKDSSIDIYHKVYAYNPWPSLYINTSNGTIKIWDVDFVDDITIKELADNHQDVSKIYDILILYKNNLYLKTKDSYLRINELQPQSRKRLTSKDFINGIKHN